MWLLSQRRRPPGLKPAYGEGRPRAAKLPVALASTSTASLLLQACFLPARCIDELASSPRFSCNLQCTSSERSAVFVVNTHRTTVPCALLARTAATPAAAKPHHRTHLYHCAHTTRSALLCLRYRHGMLTVCITTHGSNEPMTRCFFVLFCFVY